MIWIGLYCGGFLAVAWLVFWSVISSTPWGYRIESIVLAVWVAVFLAAVWPVSVPTYPLWFRR
jgi:hypothetical protein